MSLINDSKEILEAGTGQATRHLEVVKKKLKIYGLQSKIEVEMAKLGEIVFNLIQEKEKDISKNARVKNLVESIKEQQEEIHNTEQEISGENKEIEGAKKKFFETSRDFFDVIKKGFGDYEPDKPRGEEKTNFTEKSDRKDSTAPGKEPVESKKTDEKKPDVKKSAAKKTAKKTAKKKKATVKKKKYLLS